MKAFISVVSVFVLLLSHSVVSHADERQLLKGAWLDQACHSAGKMTLSAQTSFKFEGNQVLVVNRYYDSADCSGQAIYSVDYQGTLEVGEINVYANGDTVTEYSIVIPATVVESAHLDSGITLSKVDSCDIQSWSFGDTRDVFSCLSEPAGSNTIEQIMMEKGKAQLQGVITIKA